MVVPVASNVNAARLTAGATVMLNEKLVLVEQRDADTVGQIRSVKQVLDDGRLIVTDASGNPVLIRRSGALAYAGINQGDRIIVDPSVRLAIEALPAEGDKDLVLEETPDARSPTSAAWIVRLVVSGTPSNCRSSIVRCLSVTI